MWVDVDIINRALRLVRAQSISSLSEDTPLAAMVKDLYAPIKQLVLALHPWNNAIKRIKIGADAIRPQFGFKYQFSLPNDCLRVVDCNANHWQREGGKLLADNDVIAFQYIADIPAVAMNANLVRVLAARLAFELAQAQGENTALTERLYKLYEAELASAKMIDAKEGSMGDFTYASSWIDSHEGA
ncbi:MAG: hypothetical protein ACK5LE_00110 [Alphaproteobacteria bacterium]